MTSAELEFRSSTVKGLFRDSCVETLADGSVWTFSDSLSPTSGVTFDLPNVARIASRDCLTVTDKFLIAELEWFDRLKQSSLLYETHPGVVGQTVPGGGSGSEIAWHGPIGAINSAPSDLLTRFREARAEMAIALVRWLDSAPPRSDSTFEIEQTRLIARAFGDLAAAA